MRRRFPSNLRLPLSLSRCPLPAVLTALGGLISSLHAADRFWITPAGGSFSSITNWSSTDGGAGGSSVPGAIDITNFTLNSTYTVTFTAAVTNSQLVVDSGNVTLALNGLNYTITNTNNMFIGYAAGQTGRLTVREGILRVDTTGDDVFIGAAAGGTGFLTIGTESSLGTAALRPDLFVGTAGTGTLTVNDNGQAYGGLLTLGDNFSGTGTVAISGSNAVVDIVGATTIGNNGAGTVSVTSGGTLVTPGVTLASQPGADGTATVSGIGSSWAIGSSTTIGSNGDGTLTVSAGGLVTSATTVSLGSQTTGSGTATVTGAGSRWNLSGAQTIGQSGLGVMTVSSGGQVASSSSATLGNSSGSEGRVTLTGAGSRWTIGSTLAVGSSGTGDLTVSGGGEVSTSSMTLGSNASGTGAATITGTGSKLTTTTGITVAPNGSGTLNVASGGELNVGGNLTVTDPAGGTIGTLSLDGGAIYVAGAFTNNGVFAFSDGLLRVPGNFQPNPAAGHLTINGSYHGDLPTVELPGTGTTTNILNLTVGHNHRGQLLLRHGRVLNLGANTISIGAVVGGEGTIGVQSGAQLLTTGFLEVGGAPGGIAGGTGTLNIAGGTVDVGQVDLFSDGTINLSSGTLAMDVMAVLDGQFNWTGGTLRMDSSSTLNGTLVSKILGLDGTLGSGQALTFTNNMNVETPIVVDGGTLNGSTFFNSSTLEVRSGSVTVSGSVTNNAGAQLFVQRDLSVGGTMTNASGGRITLTGGTGRLLGANTLTNSGLISGDGTIVKPVTNASGGELRAENGRTLLLTGVNGPNAGRVNLQGGSIEFSQALTNSSTGFIGGRGALVTGSLTNNGQMAFSAGSTDLFGDVTLNPGSRVVTSGAGSVTTFWDDVVHNGTEIFTGAGCSTVFFGGQSGSGSYTGSGTIYFIGDLRPGNSPASISFAPQVVFSPSNVLTLEIGGLIAGPHHDKLSFTHAASPQVEWGGALTVTLINGFTPAAGDTFDVFDFDHTKDAGTFATINLPALPGGLTWDTSHLYTDGTLTILPPGLNFSQWAATALGDPFARPSADHDNDGLDNATEFALGLFPPQPGTVLPNGGFHNYGDGDRLRLLFTRPLDRTGLTLKVQASSDLLNWTDLAISTNSAPFTGPGFVTENRTHPLNEPGLVEVRDILTSSAAQRRQIRLLITLSP